MSGDVLSVPPGFEQSTLLVHSPHGATAAWDRWGVTLRRAYNTTKRTDEDVFLAALTLWTDNGAATLGPAWHSTPGTVPPPFAHTRAPGGVLPPSGAASYMNWNWSMASPIPVPRSAPSP